MERFLVAFDAPDDMGSETYEAAWDAWVNELHRRSLRLVDDIDPVVTIGSIEVYAAVAL